MRDALETAVDEVSRNGMPARPLEPEQYTRLTALTRLLLDVLDSDAPTVATVSTACASPCAVVATARRSASGGSPAAINALRFASA
jgi:hypothetical protein